MYPLAPLGYVKVTFVLMNEFFELSVLLPYTTEGAVVAAIFTSLRAGQSQKEAVPMDLIEPGITIEERLPQL